MPGLRSAGSKPSVDGPEEDGAALQGHRPHSRSAHTSPAHDPCPKALHTSPVYPAQSCTPTMHQVCTTALYTQPSFAHTALHTQPSPAYPALHTHPAHQLCPLSPVYQTLNTRSAHQTSRLLCTPDISCRRWYPKRRPRGDPTALSTTTGHSPRKGPDPGGPRAVTGQPPHPSPYRCSGLGGGQGGVLGIQPSPPNQISTRLCPHQGPAQ